MDLLQLLQETHQGLSDAGIQHALIGGFALGSYGVFRATVDIDLMVDEEQKNDVLRVMGKLGFSLEHESPEVLQFSGRGPIDLLLARRPIAKAMLKDAVLDEQLRIPVVSAEGLIGLKIQAYSNDPRRKLKDLADIQALIRAQPGIDSEKVKKFADLFSEWPTLQPIFEEKA